MITLNDRTDESNETSFENQGDFVCFKATFQSFLSFEGQQMQGTAKIMEKINSLTFQVEHFSTIIMLNSLDTPLMKLTMHHSYMCYCHVDDKYHY